MRILLADNQPKVRLALQLLLAQEEGICVVGEAANAEGLFTQIEATRPDLVLLDWDLPGGPMVDLLSVLNNTYPALSVIALSWRLEMGHEALDAGADAFISKADPPEQLLAAISSLDQEANASTGEGGHV
ncbi:MAG: response regulator transcription factor [Chloroflexi bacterium]|nr:response regulator transcription factor [Chloroflexota bacterium]